MYRSIIGAITQIINVSLCTDQQLSCHNHIDNPNPEYLWKHDGVDIVTNKRYQITSNGTLNLFKVRPTDLGLYQCLLVPSAYGTTVTQLLLAQQTSKWFFCREDSNDLVCRITAVPVISDYVFVMIHHQNHSHLVSKGFSQG